jgi:hypothetical protein
LKHREDYVPRVKFTNYLYTIAHNVVFDYFRRNKVEVDYFCRENAVGALAERGDEAEPDLKCRGARLCTSCSTDRPRTRQTHPPHPNISAGRCSTFANLPPCNTLQSVHSKMTNRAELLHQERVGRQTDVRLRRLG